MTVYINSDNNDEIFILQVDEKFEVLTDTWHEGEAEYEELADEFRELVEKQVKNPAEAYDSLDCAMEWFCPFLCW